MDSTRALAQRRYAFLRQALDSIELTCEHPDDFRGVWHLGCPRCAVRWLYYQKHVPPPGLILSQADEQADDERYQSALFYLSSNYGAGYSRKVATLYDRARAKGLELVKAARKEGRA